MDITTKGHIVTINNDQKTSKSWDGKWEDEKGTGSIATINSNQIGNAPANVVENYKPIVDPNELNIFMDPRRDLYFGHRTRPQIDNQPEYKIHDDTAQDALMSKLEHLLHKDPKVLI